MFDTSRQTHAAASSLAQALISDPFYRSVTVACGDDAAARLAMLTTYFELALVEGFEAGRVDLADSAGNGAAIWTTDAPLPLRQAAYAQREVGLRELLGPQGCANFTAIVANMEHALAQHDLQHAWYLSIAGIAPTAQGRGLAPRCWRLAWRPSTRPVPCVSWKPTMSAACRSTAGSASRWRGATRKPSPGRITG